MKQFNITFLLIVLMSMVGAKAFAHDFEVDGIYYNIVSISELTCEVTYSGDDYHEKFTYHGNISVPEYVQYNGRSLRVVGIGDYAFNNYNWWNRKKESITSISLPNSIEYIGKSALAYNSFSDFKVPSSLKRIGSFAFEAYGSKHVERVYVSDLKSWCKIVFENSASSPFCKGNRDAGIDILGLSTVRGKFYLNNKLCEVITLPNEIKKINNYAFAGIASIKEIVLPEGLESIGDFAFCNCVNLLSVKTPSTCKTIGKHAFNGCSQLSEVELSEGLESIGERAFSYCLSLQSLIFPSTIDTIGEYMFYGMDLPYLSITKSKFPLYCPRLSLCNIKTIDFQREFTCKYWWKGSGTVSLLGEMIESPFEGYPDGGTYNKLKTVTIGPNVKELHRKVFEECSLDSVVLQNSDNSILLGYERADSSYATSFGYITSNYYKCTSAFHSIPIKYLHIGRPIEVNDAELHQGATQEGASYALSGFFEKSVSFQEITIGNSVSDISFLMFEKYKDLSSVTFGSGIETIPDLTANDKLDSIVVVNNNPPSAIGFANTTYLHSKLFVPKGFKTAYESADVWKNFWNIIELELDFNTLDIKTYNESTKEVEVSIYSVDGKRINAPQKGINIVKMSDGTVKKVFVK